MSLHYGKVYYLKKEQDILGGIPISMLESMRNIPSSINGTGHSALRLLKPFKVWLPKQGLRLHDLWGLLT